MNMSERRVAPSFLLRDLAFAALAQPEPLVDSAFTRRLGAIVEFPAPGPEERGGLWITHPGDHHSLEAAQIKRIAASCELAGGSVRNAKLAVANPRGTSTDCPSRCAAIGRAYPELGQPPPGSL